MTVSTQHLAAAHMRGRSQAEAEITEGAVEREPYAIDAEMTPALTPAMLTLSITGEAGTAIENRVLAGQYATGYSMAWDAHESGTTLPDIVIDDDAEA